MTVDENPFVARLTAVLEALPEYTSASLAKALECSVTASDLEEWIKFDPLNYRRNLVIRHPRFEVRVLCWLPKQRTSLHGHDRSACAFRIIQGTATEIRLRQRDHEWSATDVVAEEGDQLVHQVTNLGAGPLVCLNAYAPPLPIDQPASVYTGRHVVIIGGGVSGAALAIHLLESTRESIRITLVERRQGLGRGPAYGTSDPAFRLNVPAERMSLFPSRPRDFVEWASEKGEHVPAGAMLPRRLFGDYVEDRLGTAITGSAGKVWFHRSEAIDATAEGVTLADGIFLRADAVVLATGNQLPAAPPSISPDLLRSERLIGDPWNDNAIAQVGKDEEVLLVGTGLTAVDVLLALKNRGHRGRIVAASRRGLLPRQHLAADDPRRRAVEVDPSSLPRKVRALCRWLKDEVRRQEAQGVGWQCVIDALRPHTSQIWDSLPLREKQLFMNRLRPYWEIVRHRAASEALASIDGWRADGTVEVVAAALSIVKAVPEGFDVTLAQRGRGMLRGRFGRIVLCTGPQTDVRQWPSPLFRTLLERKHLHPDPLGLGVLTDVTGRTLGEHGAPSSWLFTIGGLRRPHLWETTAVPDLVKQAVALAAALADQDRAETGCQ